MSQIPTFVTAVPNGTEKVKGLELPEEALKLTVDVGSLSGCRPWGNQLQSLLNTVTRRYYIFPHTIESRHTSRVDDRQNIKGALFISRETD